MVGWLTEVDGVGDSAGALTAAATNGVACVLLFYLRGSGALTLTAAPAATKVKTK